ncbi:MAG: hypothetical protein ACFCVA_01875 [Gammaproteobacteria bacterium]
MENDKTIAYGVTILGALLAAAISVVPHFDAGHRLAFGLFLWSLLPYYAYLLLSGVAAGLRLMVPGASMISVDIIGKSYHVFNRDSALGEAIGLYLPIVVLLALVAGYLVGAKLEAGKRERIG